MSQLNTSEGMMIYGKKFKGLRDFVGAHLAAAGTRNADRFHDGMGFLTQHAALTNEFEMSLQTILPKVRFGVGARSGSGSGSGSG